MSDAAAAEEVKERNAPAAIASRTAELRRTLKDLLVQDEVSDSDVEMFEKHSIDEEKNEAGNENTGDPDMCVECGDQVCE